MSEPDYDAKARRFWIEQSRDLWTVGRYRDEKGEAMTRTMDERIASLSALLRRVAGEAVEKERGAWCGAIDFLAGAAGRNRTTDLRSLIEWNDTRRAKESAAIRSAAGGKE